MISFKTDQTLNFANVVQACAAGLQQIKEGATSIDCAQLNQFDSSTLAALLAWCRQAQTQGIKLTLLNLPEKLKSLARVYGIDPLLICENSADSL